MPPALILTAAVLSVSTGAVFFRLSEAPALAAAFWRPCIATLFFLPFALRAARGMNPRLWFIGLPGGFFLAVHFAAWIASLEYTTVAASVVLVTTTPIWTALIAPRITGDRISSRAAIGIAIAFVGAVIVGLGDFSATPRALLGNGLAIIGAVTATGYMLAGRLRIGLVPVPVYLVSLYGTAAFFGALFAVASGAPLVGYSANTMLYLGLLALFPQIIGHSSYNLALRTLPAQTVSACLLGEPILSALLAWIVLSEPVTAVTFVGGAIVLTGLYFAVVGALPKTAKMSSDG
ncbi:MAG: DMT family transporter [Armatimonadetes bacterium]|nr:DMT family transporter [Armatimonadota bacterium]